MRLGPHTVVVLRATSYVTDAYGNDTSERDWSTGVARTTYQGVSVQGQPSSEFTTDRDAVTIRKELYAHVDTDLTFSDRVEYDGAVYEVDGEPQRERHGLHTDHLYALLRRSEDA